VIAGMHFHLVYHRGNRSIIHATSERGRGEMKRPKRKMSPGVSRAGRPKTGKNKGMLILLNKEERMSIEKAAAKEGVSMSRFIVERVLHAAKRVLSQLA
jgi:hypothetical protein